MSLPLVLPIHHHDHRSMNGYYMQRNKVPIVDLLQMIEKKIMQNFSVVLLSSLLLLHGGLDEALLLS